MQTGRAYLADILDQLGKIRRMGEAGISQVSDDQFAWKPDGESNSIGLIVKHITGNMRSRWTDFLTSDGEKPDRHRDTEFEDESGDSREALMRRWDLCWDLTISVIGALTEQDLLRTIRIRGEDHSVMQAINRQLVHYSTHVGQIVFLAKHLAGKEWKTLSIPRGRSVDYDVSKDGEVYRT